MFLQKQKPVCSTEQPAVNTREHMILQYFLRVLLKHPFWLHESQQAAVQTVCACVQTQGWDYSTAWTHLIRSIQLLKLFEFQLPQLLCHISKHYVWTQIRCLVSFSRTIEAFFGPSCILWTRVIECYKIPWLSYKIKFWRIVIVFIGFLGTKNW